MAKPYDHYEPGEIIEVGFNGTDKEIVKLTEKPVQHGTDWIVIGYRRKAPGTFYTKPTKWWAHTITPRPFS